MARAKTDKPIYFNDKLYTRLKRRAEFENMSIAAFTQQLLSDALYDYEEENPYDVYKITVPDVDVRMTVEAANKKEALIIFLAHNHGKFTDEQLQGIEIEEADNFLGL